MNVFNFFTLRPVSAIWRSLPLIALFTTNLTLAQPGNDTCANAITLSCGTLVSGSNQGASDDSLPSCGLTSPGKTVWYKIIGTGWEMTATTCFPATDFDSQIGIFTGSCDNLSCIAGNNDDPACSEWSLNSTVSWASTFGQTYYVVVAGLSGLTGNFDLQVDCVAPPLASSLSLTNNTSCDKARLITCGTDNISWNNINGKAASLPACAPFSADSLVWYSIIGIDGDITVSTCHDSTDFDTQIGVFTGTCSNLTCVSSDDNSCGDDATVTWTSTAGQNYYIVVGGASGATGNFELEVSRTPSVSNCNIYCISTTNRSDTCSNQGTDDWADDTFTLDVYVEFATPPSTGELAISGPQVISNPSNNTSVPVDSLTGNSYLFEGVLMQATVQKVDIELTAGFSADSSCTLTVLKAGPVWEGPPGNQNIGFTIPQCSICDPELDGASSSPYPACWPVPDTLNPCAQSVSYAPDPDFPEHTPIRYIKTVIHIFQREDPDNLGNWVVHPDDPCNFTKEHIDVIKSWFNGPEGANTHLGNLCDDINDFSPHMRDARIRLLNNGIIADSTATPGEADVFFHPDNRGWGMGVNGCEGNSSFYWNTMRSLYASNPAPNHPYFNHLNHPDIQNAFHVFLPAGNWVPMPPGEDSIPDADDCYYFGPGGFTAGPCDFSSTTNPTPSPFQVAFGWYGSYAAVTEGETMCFPGEVDPLSGSPSSMGQGMLGEIFHVLSLDHLSPFQAHWTHNDDDGCGDTPWRSSINQLGCIDIPNNRCALTQCQLGRIHHFFAEQKPAFERFPDGNGGFSMTENICDITEPDIIIPDSADLIWSGPRNLRGNVVIQSGGRLTIKCDIGMPEGAKFKVEPGGKLIVDGAKIYNNCDSTYWRGIEVEGTGQDQFPLVTNGQGLLKLNAGSMLERATRPIVVGGGGLVIAVDTDFTNCGTISFSNYEKRTISQFSNCNFVRDTNFSDFPLASGPILTSQMFFASVDGISVNNNCLFLSSNALGSNKSENAILAFNARFTVKNSGFDGYKYGVRVRKWFGEEKKFTVKDCDFANFYRGVSTWSTNNFIVDGNTMENIGSFDESGSQIGIEIRDCTGFKVEGNTLFGVDYEDSDIIGILALNTGTENNIIQRDTFIRGMHVANLAEGRNRNPLSFEGGLQYLCNLNEDENWFDFYVVGEGIAESQGSPVEAADNAFSHFNENFGDFNNRSSAAINYYHVEEESKTPLEGYYFAVFPILTANERDCKNGQEDQDIKLTAQESLDITGEFEDAKSSYDSLVEKRLNLLNGGQSEEDLINLISTTHSLGADSLKNKLVEISPYLTRAVLEEVVYRTDIFSNNDLDTILSANPDVLRAPGFQTFLYIELDEVLVSSLLSELDEVTSRTILEAYISWYRTLIHQAANRMIKSELADTNGLNLTNYRSWLIKKESIEAEYERVNSYLLDSNFTVARVVRDSIPIKFSLKGVDSIEHLLYVGLCEIAIDAFENDIHYASLDSATVLGIQGIADSSLRLAGAMAQGLLNVFYGYNYELAPYSPAPPPQRPYMPPGNNNNVIDAYQPLTVRPNPAKGEVVFSYSLPNLEVPATLTIYNIYGHVVKEFSLQEESSDIRWIAGQVSRGIYYCQIRRKGKAYPALKLVLAK
ncbi:MAG: T9SS type A sorting domain-containing protein [Lewinellaceae bacterium]|nr:T9SS type A sorting domain-containing protein [Lewinellaceae bacterium]